MIAVTSNADTFSPAKFLLAFFVLFHVGALFDPPSQFVLALMLVPLSLIFLVTFTEASAVQYRPLDRPRWTQARNTSVITVAIWVLSSPAILSQMAMIYEFGGLAGYVNSVNTRVADWSGFGWARTLIATLTVFNIVYFAIGLHRRQTAGWWSAYAVHLAIVLALGLLSGSRSGLLNVFALMIVCFHYLKRPIRMPVAAGMVVLLSLAASVLGVARNGFKLDDGQLSTGLSNSTESFSLNAFSYGIEPLTLIDESPRLVLAHGSTFVSLVTNMIPRSIYPGKPDTGGVWLTKYYAGDAWEGLSNLTPTFLGEWIINFGWLAGIVGFAVTYGLMCFLIMRWYVRLFRERTRKADSLFAIDVVIYVHTLWTLVGLMPGELTNVVLGYALTQLLPLLVLRMFVKAMLSRDARRGPGFQGRSGSGSFGPGPGPVRGRQQPVPRRPVAIGTRTSGERR
ncbi:O-antigen polymerase [Tsuneonella sp. HG094]